MATPTAATPEPATCDYSGTGEPVIKGNIGGGGDRIYHTPDSPYYSRTQIDEGAGERWFCTVDEAVAAGWRAPAGTGSATATATVVPATPPTPTWTPAPTPSPTPPPQATAAPATAPALPSPTPVSEGRPDVRIRCVFYDGVAGRGEPDEYVEIVNLGDAPQDLSGWRLADVSDGTPEFLFPSHTLEAGGTIRVYTDEVHPQWGGFSFGRGSAAWSNSDPDTAGLFDEAGKLVSTASYPPGC